MNKKARINLEKTSVLLLDDPKAGTDVLGQVFFGFGVRQPCRCSTAGQAMIEASKLPFELIVCDGDLPGGQAYEFVSNLRRSNLEPNRFCSAIILSAHTPLDQIDTARNCGASFVVAKPLRPLVLLERIFWVAQENRTFVELANYVGPDRRFHHLGPPPNSTGRRKGDSGDVAHDPGAPNMSQDEIDGLLKPTKAAL